MASGKATPRQKMINMMYLVLTALLALNVSAELLNAFQTLANSLRSTSMKLTAKNSDLGKMIIGSVKKEMEKGNDKNRPVLDMVKEVEDSTNAISDLLESYIDSLKQPTIAGYDTVKKTLVATDERDKNYAFWMMRFGNKLDTDNEGHGDGYARIMRERLKKFVDWANKRHIDYQKNKDGKLPQGVKADEKPFEYFCIEPADDPTVPQGDNKNKTWEYYTFHSTPAIANVAILEKFRSDVRVIETDLLEILKGKLSEIEFKIDKFIAVAAPKSEIVPAGLPFEAKIYVVSASTQAKPSFSGPGVKPDPKDKGQTAILKLMANANVIKSGEKEGFQSYNVTIRMPKQDGTDEILKVNEKFKVRKPEVVVKGKAIQIMYRNCANDIEIDVPVLGDLYNPKIEATGGGNATLSKKNVRSVRVVPTGKNIKLTVFQVQDGGSYKIDDVAYNVIDPPLPQILVTVGGKEVGPKDPINVGAPIRIIVKADKDFADALPEDARYRIGSIKVLRKRGLSSPAPVKTEGPSAISKPKGNASSEIKLISVWDSPQNGETAYFEIDKIERINFQDKPETVFDFNKDPRQMTITATIAK